MIVNSYQLSDRTLEIKPDNEFLDLYSSVDHGKLREILAALHAQFVSLFESMNSRLPTGADGQAHFWADPSRSLIEAIDVGESLQKALKSSSLAFNVDPYYRDIFQKCNEFLSSSGGSTLPPNMKKVDIYYTIPIFIKDNMVTVSRPSGGKSFSLQLIGEGSYAQVFRYRDDYYQRTFVLKRAKKDLTPKEIQRFRREFEQMRDLNSPYIVDVYRYLDKSNEYIMEHMDMTLDGYITTNNAKLTIAQRRNIGNQILKAFSYIHSKGLLHRDVSPKNVLIKKYDDVLVVKISDFGLVRIADSTLTSANTEFKGYFNDPSLLIEGFDKYSILHETYALTRLLSYVMTGKTRTDKITDSKLHSMVSRGIDPTLAKRFQSIEELSGIFRSI